MRNLLNWLLEKIVDLLIYAYYLIPVFVLLWLAVRVVRYAWMAA